LEVKPIQVKVVLTTPTVYTFDPLNSIYDFNLLRVGFTLTSEGMMGKFSLKIEDSNASLLNSLDCGDRVEIYCAKSLPWTKMFLGIVEEREVVRPSKDILTYELTGCDFGARLVKRIINMYRYQNRLADGITADPTDTKTEIGQMVSFMIQNIDAYPTGYPTIENEDNITLDVDNTAIKIPAYVAEYKPASDILKELAEMSGRNWWVGNDKTLHFKATAVTHSGICLADTTQSSWDQTKVGYIVDEESFRVKYSIVDMKNRIFGIGGDEIKKDQYQETVSGGSQTMFDYYRAIKFTPTERHLQYVAVYAGKTGTPNVRISGEIREDKSNSPTGALLKAFSQEEGVVVAGGGWVIFDVGVEHIQTGKDHWLILYKAGSSGNTFNWFHDGGTSSTRAYSADGINWTVLTGTIGYGYRTYNAVQLLNVVQDLDSIINYGYSEYVHSNPEIVERVSMMALLRGLMLVLPKKKVIVGCKVFPPDTMLNVGQYVRIKDSKLNIDGDFEITSLTYDFNADDEYGVTSFDIEAIGLVK